MICRQRCQNAHRHNTWWVRIKELFPALSNSINEPILSHIERRNLTRKDRPQKQQTFENPTIDHQQSGDYHPWNGKHRDCSKQDSVHQKNHQMAVLNCIRSHPKSDLETHFGPSLTRNLLMVRPPGLRDYQDLNLPQRHRTDGRSI